MEHDYAFEKARADSLVDDLEKTKTDAAVQTAQLREQVNELMLEISEINAQLDDVLATRK